MFIETILDICVQQSLAGRQKAVISMFLFILQISLNYEFCHSNSLKKVLHDRTAKKTTIFQLFLLRLFCPAIFTNFKKSKAREHVHWEKILHRFGQARTRMDIITQ